MTGHDNTQRDQAHRPDNVETVLVQHSLGLGSDRKDIPIDCHAGKLLKILKDDPLELITASSGKLQSQRDNSSSLGKVINQRGILVVQLGIGLTPAQLLVNLIDITLLDKLNNRRDLLSEKSLADINILPHDQIPNNYFLEQIRAAQIIDLMKGLRYLDLTGHSDQIGLEIHQSDGHQGRRRAHLSVDDGGVFDVGALVLTGSVNTDRFSLVGVEQKLSENALVVVRPGRSLGEIHQSEGEACREGVAASVLIVLIDGSGLDLLQEELGVGAEGELSQVENEGHQGCTLGAPTDCDS